MGDFKFRTKGAIALEQIQQALVAGLPPGVVLADAASGTEAEWRDQLSEWGLTYAGGVRENTTVWYGSSQPAPMPPQTPGHGRPRTRLVVNARRPPLSVWELAQRVPARSFRTFTWRAGPNSPFRSRFSALGLRAAHDLRARA